MKRTPEEICIARTAAASWLVNYFSWEQHAAEELGQYDLSTNNPEVIGYLEDLINGDRMIIQLLAVMATALNCCEDEYTQKGLCKLIMEITPWHKVSRSIAQQVRAELYDRQQATRDLKLAA